MTEATNRSLEHDVSSNEEDVIHFDFNDHRLLVMTQETMDKLVFPISRAITACANQAAADSFDRAMREKFLSLASTISEWGRKRKPTVRAALMDPRDFDKYMLVVVVDNESPDANLGDDVADLAMDLYRKFPEYPLSVMTLPASKPSSIGAFIDPENALLIYADDTRASSNR